MTPLFWQHKYFKVLPSGLAMQVFPSVDGAFSGMKPSAAGTLPLRRDIGRFKLLQTGSGVKVVPDLRLKGTE